MEKKVVFSLATLFFGFIFLSGCNVNEINDSVQGYFKSNQSAIEQAEEIKNQTGDYNPVFDSEENKEANTPVAKEISDTFGSVLTAVFTEAKMISTGNTDTTPFILRYVVKRKINQNDGEALYQELLKQECRVKEGGSPNFLNGKNTIEMSVFKDVGGKSYTLAVLVDMGEQIIWVNIY